MPKPLLRRDVDPLSLNIIENILKKCNPGNDILLYDEYSGRSAELPCWFHLGESKWFEKRTVAFLAKMMKESSVREREPS